MEQHELFKSIYASNLKSRAINVMSCLITYMNRKDNTCFPSIKTIAKCCSMGVSTVKRALSDLVEAGFIIKETRFLESKNGAQTSNLYYLQKVDVSEEIIKESDNDIDEDDNESETEIEEVSFETMIEEKEINCVDVNKRENYFYNMHINKYVIICNIKVKLPKRAKIKYSQVIKWTGG